MSTSLAKAVVILLFISTSAWIFMAQRIGSNPYISIGLNLIVVLPAIVFISRFDHEFSSHATLKLIGFFVFVSGLIALLSRILTPNFDFWYADKIGIAGNFVYFVVIYLPIQTFLEEFMVRGIIQRTISEIYDSRVAFWIASSVFICMHLTWFILTNNKLFGTIILLSIIPYSLLLAMIYARTSSFMAVFLAHLAVNIIASLQIMLHITGSPYEYLLWASWVIPSVFFLKHGISNFRTMIEGFKKQFIPRLWDCIYLFSIILLPIILDLIYYSLKGR
jgi:membrane protease YdiL (CAAX protease family)